MNSGLYFVPGCDATARAPAKAYRLLWPTTNVSNENLSMGRNTGVSARSRAVTMTVESDVRAMLDAGFSRVSTLNSRLTWKPSSSDSID